MTIKVGVRVEMDAAGLKSEAAAAEKSIHDLGNTVEQTGKTAAATAVHVDALGAKVNAAGDKAKNFGRAAQQAGYQIGDFATQVASGGNWVVALTQQGTQLLGMFGTWGAVIGAAGAVVGALATYLMRADDATKDGIVSAADYADTIRQARIDVAAFNGDLRTLILLRAADVNAARAQSRAQAEVKIAEAETRNRELQSIVDQAKQSGRYGPGVASKVKEFDDNARAIANARQEIDLLDQAMEIAVKKIRDEVNPEVRETAARLSNTSKAAHEAAAGMTSVAKAIQENGYEKLLKNLDEEKRLLGLSSEARETEIELRQYEQRLQQQGITLSDQERETLRSRIAELNSLAEVQEQSNRAAQQAAADQQRRIERGTDQVVDFFADAFTKSDASFSDLMDSFLATAKRTFAQIAAESIIRPIVQPIVSSVLGGLGSGTSSPSAGGSFFSGANLSNFASLSNIFGISGGSAGLTAKLFGSPNLGRPGLPIDGLLGSGGALFGSTGAANFVGAGLNYSPYGIIGSLGANLLGLSGKYSGIGSAVGGFAGAGLGSMLGEAGGPIGAIVGAFLGSALGGIGPKPSNKEGNVVLNSNDFGLAVGGQDGKKFSQENRDAASKIGQSLAIYGKLFEQLSGQDLGSSLRVGVGARDGIYAEFGQGNNNAAFGGANTSRVKFDQSEEGIKKLVNYVAQQWASAVQSGLPEAVQTAIKNIDFSSETAAQDLQFAANFGDLFGLNTKTINPAAEALKALSDQADEFRATATRLGLSLAEVDSQAAKAADKLRSDFVASLNNDLASMNAPEAVKRQQLYQQFQAELEAARTFGGGENLVIEKYQGLFRVLEDQTGINQYLNDQRQTEIDLKSQQISQIESEIENRQNLIQSLRSQDNALLLNGQLSTLNGRGRYDEAKRQLEEAFSRLQANPGDTQAQSDFTSLRQQFLEISRDYNSVSATYEADFNATMEMSKVLQSSSQTQIQLAQQQLSALRQSVGLLEQLVNANDNSPDYVKDSALQQAIRLSSGYSGSFGNGAFNQYVTQATRNSTQDFGSRPDVNRTLAVISNYGKDFGAGGFQNYIRTGATEAQRNAARLFLQSIGEVPGFANGGTFGGGVRLVGERGPEIELTGPSRIINNNDVRRMLASGNDNMDMATSLYRLERNLMAGLQDIVAEIRGLRDDMGGYARASDRAARQMADAVTPRRRAGT